MAQRLARIHGTEEDKVNCPFYFKIGACRHGDRCSRIHHRPAFSQTILIKNIYRNPIREAELKALATGNDTSMIGGVGMGSSAPATCIRVDEHKAQEDFLVFFEDMYEELAKFGKIECLCVCDNLGDHMIGHVYVKFEDEEEAADALNVMNGRHYDGRKMEVEFSPVTDFREARCRDFDEETCGRGGFCNFMHIKPVPMCLIGSLQEDCDYERMKEEEERRRERDREHRRKKRKHRDRDRGSGSGGGGGGGSSSKKRHRDRRSYSSSRSRSRSRDRSRSRSLSSGGRSPSPARSPGKP